MLKESGGCEMDIRVVVTDLNLPSFASLKNVKNISLRGERPEIIAEEPFPSKRVGVCGDMHAPFRVC